MRNFSWQFLFTLRVFARNLLRGNRRRNTFRILFRCLAWARTLAFRLISQYTYWPYDLVAIIHDAPHHCNRRKQWAKPSYLTELDVFFSILAHLDASIGMIGLWFQCHSNENIDSSPVMTSLSKSGLLLNDVNISWVMSMWRYFCIKFNNVGTIFAALPYFLHCFNVFTDCWRVRANRKSIVIDVFSAFIERVIPQLNLCSAHSRLVKHHSQHFKCPCTFNLIFYTKLNIVFLIHFFRIVKNRIAHQNTINLFICQKQTDNPKWLILSVNICNRQVYQHNRK